MGPALAVLMVASLLFAPPAASQDGDDLTDQAATYAIRAIASAGLLDPLGQHYSYEEIVRTEGGWVASFQSSTCYRNEQIETCDPNTGTREDPQIDAWLEVAIHEERFVVTDAFGRFTEEQASDLRRYSEPATVEPTHLEGPTVRVDRSLDDDGWEVRAVLMWAGPLPARGVWNVCRQAMYDEAGEVLWRGSAAAFTPRFGEGGRSYGLWGAGTNDPRGEPARAALECEPWSGETWTRAGAASAEPSRGGDYVAVSAPLEWEHRKIVGLESRCRVRLLGRDGSVVETHVVRGPPSPWAGRPREETWRVDIRTDRADSVRRATVKCVARGQKLRDAG